MKNQAQSELTFWNGGARDDAEKLAKWDRQYVAKKQRNGDWGVWDKRSLSWVEFSLRVRLVA